MPRLIARRPNRLDALYHRLRTQHYARSATEWPIVDLPMLPLRPVAYVVDMNTNKSRNNRSLQHALAQVAGENFRKQGKDVDAHRFSIVGQLRSLRHGLRALRRRHVLSLAF